MMMMVMNDDDATLTVHAHAEDSLVNMGWGGGCGGGVITFWLT